MTSQEARDSMLIYLGKLRGILSVVEFDENDEDSAFIHEKLNDVLNDMELTLKNVDELPY
jgi:hypothetical protein